MYLARFIVATGIAVSVIRPVYAQTVQLPGGGTVTITQSQTTDGGSVKTTEEAKGTGASGEAKGDKSELKIDGSAPTAKLPGRAESDGGSVKSSGSAKIDASLFGNPLLWAGILSWLAAAVSVYLRLPLRVALIAVAAGAAFICAALFPAAMLFLVGGTAVAGVGFFVWSSMQADQGAKAKEALRAVVAGVATAPIGAAEAVKAEIAKHADESDKAVIKKVKKADDLP